MNFKIVGAVCVVVGCGSCGFIMAAQYLSNIRLLRNLIIALDFMECELQYRCTPLPLLCRLAGEQVTGKIHQIFVLLADELDAQISPDIQRCMASGLDRIGNVGDMLCGILLALSCNLGKFDLTGQLRALENGRNLCREKLEQLQKGKETRLRSYQTLGLCAGAAIAILLV